MAKWKCEVCSYVHEGDTIPDKCPVCHAAADRLTEQVEDAAEEEVEQPAETKIPVEESVPEDSVVEEVVQKKGVEESNEKYWKCTICGYIHQGYEAPEECPLCKVGPDKFIEVDEDGKEVKAKDPLTKPLPDKQGGKKKGEKKSILVRLNSRLHLHPISVHFPNGILPLALLLLIGALSLGIKSFEVAAYYNMIFVLATMPVVLGTGFIEWKERFRSAKTLLFITKIFCAGIVTICLSVMVLWRFIMPDVAGVDSPYRLIYLIIGLVMVGAAGIAGHLGGKLVFNSRS